MVPPADIEVGFADTQVNPNAELIAPSGQGKVRWGLAA
jgi:hypothetical protein